MVKSILLSVTFLIHAKLKKLGHGDVPREAWPWVILQSVLWTISTLMLCLAMTTVSLWDLFAVYDAVLLSAWTWSEVRLKRPSLVLLSLAMTFIGLTLMAFSNGAESSKKYSHFSGVMFGVFASTFMAAVAGTIQQVKQVNFTLLMFAYNFTAAASFLIWDFIVWANGERVMLQSLGSWKIIGLVFLAFVLEFGARTIQNLTNLQLSPVLVNLIGHSALIFASALDLIIFNTQPSVLSIVGTAIMILTNVTIVLYHSRAERREEVRRKKEEAVAAIKRAR